MILLTLRRAAVIAAALCPCAALAAGGSDLDTTNGVAPVHPQAPGSPEKAGPTSPAPAKVNPADASRATDVQRYCQNVAAAAVDARNAWQAKKLAELQTQVARTITELETRQAELKEVLARRDDALKRADATLVGIFAKMKPDSAAAQLSALDDEMAAAVLQQLNPRAASAILNEITPERAVRLVNTIAGTQPADGKKS